jgi:hypothetical protein
MTFSRKFKFDEIMQHSNKIFILRSLNSGFCIDYDEDEYLEKDVKIIFIFKFHLGNYLRFKVA